MSRCASRHLQFVASARIIFHLQWKFGGSWDTPYRALEICRRLKLLQKDGALAEVAPAVAVAVAYTLAHKFSSVSLINTGYIVGKVADLCNVTCTADAACTAETTAFQLLGWKMPPIDDTLGGIIHDTCAKACDNQRQHAHKIARGLLCLADTPERFRLSNVLLATVCCTSASLADAKRAVVALTGLDVYRNASVGRKRGRTATPPPS